ncbi:MAG TPA: glycosyltransferase family 1 protein [Solirubrobacteraceae bacterium]|jgi:alpha-1,3-rhamnosyl/mannosyltransferase|nr:glycosyltransferase family 1 protein [Solirubrobacteraceae bacterium]
MSIPRSLTIGIDARAAAEVPAGRGRVVRELLRALAARNDEHRYVLYAREPWRGAELDGRFEWHTIAARDPWWHLLAARRANRACDVFLSTNSYLTVWFLKIPAVPIVYDLTTFEPSMRPNRRSTVIERATLGHAVRRAAAILVISHATDQALQARFARARGRTVVALLGADPLPSGDRLSAEEAAALPREGFVLAVGTLEPRKNLPRLVAAYRRLDDALQLRHPIVVVGALGWETGETLQALHSLGERAKLLGYVSDAQLGELYRRCAIFCYPSLGEGFGLPVLEAMAAGAPVVTSDLSSLPEVGGDAAEYVDPHDVGSIAAGIRRVLEDGTLRERLAQAGPRRASEFSWTHFAEQTLAVLQDASTRS